MAQVREYEAEMDERREAGGEEMRRAVRKVRGVAQRIRRHMHKDISLNGSWFKLFRKYGTLVLYF